MREHASHRTWHTEGTQLMIADPDCALTVAMTIGIYVLKGRTRNGPPHPTPTEPDPPPPGFPTSSNSITEE